MDKNSKKDIYYTPHYEWIGFQGSTAYIGLCSFKLSGFRDIHQIIFNQTSEFVQQGKVIATIKYYDYVVKMRMPVDGRIIQLNPLLLNGEKRLLLEQPEDNGWIALIIPERQYDRIDLLTAEQYKEKNTFKYAGKQDV